MNFPIITQVLVLFFTVLQVTSFNVLNHKESHFQQSSASNNQSQLSQLKQLLSYIQDPAINSLLKLNLQTLLSQRANMLESWYSKQQIETIIEIKKSLNSWKQCPKKQPYFDGQTCISCQNAGEVFDIVTKKCAICRSGTIYDKKKKTCVKKNSMINIALTQMNLQMAEEILIIRANRIAASMMSFVHEETDKLKFRVDTNSQYVNFVNGTSNVTNPHFLNLVVFSKNQKIQDLQLGFDDIPCPKQNPFYSGDRCISCNYPTHLFDMTTKFCVKCSSQHIYSVKRHKCVKNPAHL